MSFQIFWVNFDQKVANNLKNFLNQHLETLETPDFLGKLSIDTLDFGTEPPVLEIKDICDPSEIFYEERRDGDEVERGNHRVEDRTGKTYIPRHNSNIIDSSFSGDLSSNSIENRQYLERDKINHFSYSEDITTKNISKFGTATSHQDIYRQTHNKINHKVIKNENSSKSTRPKKTQHNNRNGNHHRHHKASEVDNSAIVYPWESVSMAGLNHQVEDELENDHLHSNKQLYQEDLISNSSNHKKLSSKKMQKQQELPQEQHETSFYSASGAGYLADNSEHFNRRHHRSSVDDIHGNEHINNYKIPNSLTGSIQNSPSNSDTESKSLESTNDTDIQLEVYAQYDGNLCFKIKTELIVNQPTPKFMVLPLTLCLTGFSFKAFAILAYVNGTINFCFRKPEKGSILEDVHIETEIGDEAKQVLRNVRKIENFIVEQILSMVNNLLIFPSFYSMPLESNVESYHEENQSLFSDPEDSDAVSID